jgi:hypothetical protein
MSSPRLLVIVGNIATRFIGKRRVDKAEFAAEDTQHPEFLDVLEHFRLNGLPAEPALSIAERVFGRIVHELMPGLSAAPEAA